MWAYGDEHPVGSDSAAVMTDMMLEFVADLVSRCAGLEEQPRKLIRNLARGSADLCHRPPHRSLQIPLDFNQTLD